MTGIKIDQMDTDDLWALHGELTPVATKTPIGKARSEARLKQLAVPVLGHRPYPALLPKYSNPDQPSETWAGRGKQPRWFSAQLRSGRQIEDCKIRKTADS